MTGPSVTQVLGVFSDFSAIRPDVLAHASDRGTRIHEVCSRIALGVFAPIDDDIRGYVKSFQTWMDRCIDDVIFCEERLISEFWGYHGKPDLVVKYKNEDGFTLVDLKSPANLSRSWRCQVAAYAKLLEGEGLKIKRVGTLRLVASGKMPFFDDVLPLNDAWIAFINALQAYKYLKGGN